MKLVKKIYGIGFHRNGVFGTGFHVVRFSGTRDAAETPKSEFVATVFPEAGACAVIRLLGCVAGTPLIDPVDINSRSRGDLFEPELRAAIEEWEKARAA